MFPIPSLDQWNVQRSSGPTGPHIERPRGPQQCDAVGRVVRVQGAFLQKRLNDLVHFKLLVIFGQKVRSRRVVAHGMPVRNRIDQRIKVKRG
jgi:hypothetical protein